jgi:hypothetical protein
MLRSTGCIFGLALCLAGGADLAQAGPFEPVSDTIDANVLTIDDQTLSEPVWDQSLDRMSASAGSDAVAEQHPMIPLPPAVFAGMGTLLAVGAYTLRVQRRFGLSRR